MNGWLFKEIRHHWYLFLAAVLIPVFFRCLSVFMMFSVSGKEHYTLKECFQDLCDPVMIVLQTGMLIFAYLLFGLFLQDLFLRDEVKNWGYFVMTTPDGVKRFLYMKYVILFLLCSVFFVSFYLTESALQTVAYLVSGCEMMSLSALGVMMFFLQLLLRSLDYPGVVRFGTMVGVKIKLWAVAGLLAAAGIWLLFGPLPEHLVSFFDWLGKTEVRFLAGEYGEQTALVLSLLPPVTLILFCCSYRLSCRLYRKGVEGYGK